MNSEERTIGRWLLLCCFFVFAIIVVGAITRLTESGLSMVEWRVVMDILPPMNDAAWQSEFALYQNSPQYLLVNAGMTISEFKTIYFWEWFHRLLGRVTGLVYAVPFFFFWIRSKIPMHLKRRLAFYLLLGALQGFFGWFMVKSGLVGEPRVSHFRLALHLGTALLLLCLLWVTGMQLLGKMRPPMFRRHGRAALILTCLTILYGAFVAGLDAGIIYNTFPRMGGEWVPSEFLYETPWWKNFFYNHATVQWMHRMLGVATFIVVFSLGLRFHHGGARIKGATLCGFVFVQFFLGIATLLSVVALPLAVLHQAFAVLTLIAVVTVNAEERA